MKETYESRVIDDNIIYFKFYKSDGVESYASGLIVFKEFAAKPSIDTLMVVIEDSDVMFGPESQHIWKETAKFADENGVIKWGVVVPDMTKQITIEHLISGGEEDIYDYDYKVSNNEEDILEWCRSK